MGIKYNGDFAFIFVSLCSQIRYYQHFDNFCNLKLMLQKDTTFRY